MRDYRFADRVPVRWVLILLAALLVTPSTGCRLCCDSEDLAYPAYGGSWQRTRRDAGRVGSLFDPAGGRTAELTDRDAPQSVDELYRARQSTGGLDPEEAAIQGTDDDAADAVEPNDPDERNELQRRADEIKDLQLEDIQYHPPSRVIPQLH